MKTLITVLAAAALLAAACGDDTETGTGDDPPTTPTGTATATPTPTPTPSATPEPTATPEPDPTPPTPDPPGPTPRPTDTATPVPTPTEPSPPTERCENPEGFTIAHPADWYVNSGETVAPCSQFDPEPFEVPEGTDERVAAITAFVDPVPFFGVASPDDDEVSRATTAVDGHQAVRITSRTGADSIYGEGVAVTRYVVDLSTGTDDGPGTLIVDTVDLSSVDYDRAVRVLDEMFRTLELTVDDPREPGPVVARYEGGGTPFSVTAETTGGEVCLSLRPADVATCVPLPEATGVSAARLGDDLAPVVVGAAGPEVFRVVAVRPDGVEIAFLPTPVPGSDVRAWAIPGDLAGIDSIETYSLGGDALASFAIETAGGTA